MPPKQLHLQAPHNGRKYYSSPCWLTVESTASTATRKMWKWYQRRLSLVDFSNHSRSLRTQFDPHKASSARPLRRRDETSPSSSGNSSRRPTHAKTFLPPKLPNRTTASPSYSDQNAIINLAATHSTYTFFLVARWFFQRFLCTQCYNRLTSVIIKPIDFYTPRRETW